MAWPSLSSIRAFLIAGGMGYAVWYVLNWFNALPVYCGILFTLCTVSQLFFFTIPGFLGVVASAHWGDWHYEEKLWASFIIILILLIFIVPRAANASTVNPGLPQGLVLPSGENPFDPKFYSPYIYYPNGDAPDRVIYDSSFNDEIVCHTFWFHWPHDGPPQGLEDWEPVYVCVNIGNQTPSGLCYRGFHFTFGSLLKPGCLSQSSIQFTSDPQTFSTRPVIVFQTSYHTPTNILSNTTLANLALGYYTSGYSHTEYVYIQANIPSTIPSQYQPVDAFTVLTGSNSPVILFEYIFFIGGKFVTGILFYLWWRRQ